MSSTTLSPGLAIGNRLVQEVSEKGVKVLQNPMQRNQKKGLFFITSGNLGKEGL